MRIRQEISGTHLFDRVSGLHILLDGHKVLPQNRSIAPRTVSIALTNMCDLNCPFCYVQKSEDSVPLDFMLSLARKLDELGTLEITLGGGEPLLYPHFIELCNWVWNNTSLGISVTTNGHHLSPAIISAITGKISSIRFSVDGIEPRYSKVKGRPLQRLLDIISNVKGKIPYCINVVVSPGQVSALRSVIELGIGIGSENILVIPEHKYGKFSLSTSEWQELNEIINQYESRTQLYTTYDAYDYLNIACLDTEAPGEFLFAHVSVDKKLKPSSFCEEGILIEDVSRLEEYFLTLRRSKGGRL